MMMKVTVIGTGYVGLVSGTCFAELGHHVTCVDIDEEKINMLRSGKSPIYEPGLDQLLKRNIEDDRLHFSTDFESVRDSSVIFLAVGTPSSENGEADLSYLKSAAQSVAKNISDNSYVVIKSTVPVGTSKKIRAIMEKETGANYQLISNPEFLKEGVAISDFMKPDRVVVGVSDNASYRVMKQLYAPLVRQGNPIIRMSVEAAELTKYAANCFLATKISFINEIARLCDLTGANIDEVRNGIMSDRRIGKFFLYPGLGYGGSCFPKDVEALIQTAKGLDLDLQIINSAKKVNDEQKTYLFKKVMDLYKGNIKGKHFTFWGVAFKPNTDDIREAPSIYLAQKIIEAGGKIKFYDPIAEKNFLKYMAKYKDSISATKNRYECLKDSEGLFVITEWPEFHNPNFEKIKSIMKRCAIFDGRNLYDAETIIESEVDYFGVGKNIRV